MKFKDEFDKINYKLDRIWQFLLNSTDPKFKERAHKELKKLMEEKPK